MGYAIHLLGNILITRQCGNQSDVVSRRKPQNEIFQYNNGRPSGEHRAQVR